MITSSKYDSFLRICFVGLKTKLFGEELDLFATHFKVVREIAICIC